MAKHDDSAQREWERDLANVLARAPERREKFTTSSGTEVRRLYTEADVAELSPGALQGRFKHPDIGGENRRAP